MVGGEIFVVIVKNIRRVCPGDIVWDTRRLDGGSWQTQNMLAGNIAIIILYKYIFGKQVYFPRIRVEENMRRRNPGGIDPAVEIIAEKIRFLSRKMGRKK